MHTDFICFCMTQHDHSVFGLLCNQKINNSTGNNPCACKCEAHSVSTIICFSFCYFSTSFNGPGSLFVTPSSPWHASSFADNCFQSLSKNSKQPFLSQNLTNCSSLFWALSPPHHSLHKEICQDCFINFCCYCLNLVQQNVYCIVCIHTAQLSPATCEYRNS
jgi:hypothetical protein